MSLGTHLHMDDRDGGSINLPWPLTPFLVRRIIVVRNIRLAHIPFPLLLQFFFIIIIFMHFVSYGNNKYQVHHLLLQRRQKPRNKYTWTLPPNSRQNRTWEPFPHFFLSLSIINQLHGKKSWPEEFFLRVASPDEQQYFSRMHVCPERQINCPIQPWMMILYGK